MLWEREKMSNISDSSYEGRKGIIQGKEDNFRGEMSRHNQRTKSWEGAHSVLLSMGRRSLGYNTQRQDERRVS